MNETATPPPPPPAPPEPPPTGGGAAGTPSSNRSVMVVLSYLWLLALIPLLVEKEDTEVQWHAKHGLVLFGVEVLLLVALSILSSVLACIGCAFVPIVSLAFLVVRILCMVKGLNGERFTVPMVSEFADKF